ncbi:MAG: YchJ family metal-binding protein [Porticoccaceae bacterium]|nr:YchJ family metal-binding protein [Porticoccaceae bacterium]MDG1474149.1 YchJ family metal-binding protein [Porticoccaceae bacterium]
MLPQTPEQLMRSRYVAYALGGHGNYLLKTWFPPMAKMLSEAQLSKKTQDWQGLEVIESGTNGSEGWVEFKATFNEAGQIQIMHERSVFTFVAGKWFYIGGDIK